MEVLNRLIGGDGEIEIQIRESIAQEFIKNQMKPLLTHTLRTEFPNMTITAAIAEVIKKHHKLFLDELLDNTGKSSKLKKADEEKLRENIKASVHTIIVEVIRDMLNEETLKNEVVRQVELYKESVIKAFKKELLHEANFFIQKQVIPQVLNPLISNLQATLTTNATSSPASEKS